MQLNVQGNQITISNYGSVFLVSYQIFSRKKWEISRLDHSRLPTFCPVLVPHCKAIQDFSQMVLSRPSCVVFFPNFYVGPRIKSALSIRHIKTLFFGCFYVRMSESLFLRPHKIISLKFLCSLLKIKYYFFRFPAIQTRPRSWWRAITISTVPLFWRVSSMISFTSSDTKIAKMSDRHSILFSWLWTNIREKK